jgi:predicted molibdopterin-dependent oxidoreductase YjgC
MSYEKLRQGGIQWPCNDEHPEGATRLYGGGQFFSAVEAAETFGHDLVTGGLSTQEKYAAHDPRGKAILKSAEYEAPVEEPDAHYPFWLTTGRIVYHFHTRTKTAHAPELEEAAPEVTLEISAEDAQRLRVSDWDSVKIQSRRGIVYAKARIADIKPGHLFLPFHYGYFDGVPNAAANELTITSWDPVSKQPSVKYAAVSVSKV